MNKNEAFYKAMLARDYRFDGKFFVGVKTTGIYCRPICPAKPKKENVTFFATATAAEKAGFRPCLRCRPESAPLSPAWVGTSATVNRALKVLGQHGFISENEDRFAEQFGVSARHLRRLFMEEVGLTPKQIAFNNRLNFARKLIVESGLSMTDIAHSAGFSSVRRFNDSFKRRFHRTPSQIRKKEERSAKENGVELSLSYRPPLHWPSLLDFYRRHQIIGIEKITEDSYERIFTFGKKVGLFRVTNVPETSSLRLFILLDDPSALFFVAQKVRQMFDLDSDPLLIANAFQADSFLNKLYNQEPGLRLASAWDPFESAICTILGQLVSLKQARLLVSQLVRTYGDSCIHPETGEEVFLFPHAKTLAQSDLAAVKTTKVRKKALQELARLVLSKNINLELPPAHEELHKQLLAVNGIGDWTAEYMSLRAFGNTDAFPKTDLILQRALEKHPRLQLEKMRPWRSYVAIYLWHIYATALSKSKGTKK